MSRRVAALIIVVAISGAACGRLGVGLPSCEPPSSNPKSATLLTLQAVPTADYAPCLNSVKLGWDEVNFSVERGQATIKIGREMSAFLEVRLTETCDIGEAVPVPSGMPDIERYEAIDQVDSEIRVTIIPTGERPRIHALMMAKDLEGVRVDDRTVTFTVDEAVDFSVLTRVNAALFTDDYVWIIDDLDMEEDTLELRRSADSEGARGLSVNEALHRIDEMTPDVRYKGQWYLVFNGGCITYDFNASGTVAETIAQDVEEAIGLFPNGEFREEGRRHGFELIDE